MQTLQTSRDDAVRSISTLEDQVSNLMRQMERSNNAEEKASISPFEQQTRVHQVNAKSDKAKLNEQLNQLRGQISRSRQTLAEMDRRIAFEGSVKAAKQDATNTRKAKDEALAKVGEIEQRRDALVSRLQGMRNELAGGAAAIQEAHSDAAKGYGAAFSQGNAAEVKQTEKILTEAVIALEAFRAKERVKQDVFRAMESDIEGIDCELASQKESVVSLDEQLHKAESILISIKWDAKVDELLQIGAELLDAQRSAGISDASLEKISLPRLSSYRALPLSFSDIKNAAAQRTQNSNAA